MFSKTAQWRKFEPACFYVLLLGNCSLLFVSKYFPTLDGPAHLYNSTIIADLLFNDNSIYKEFFALNSQFPPNVLNHVLLILLKSILPWFIAEKAILLIHLVFTPILFRSVLKIYDAPHNWMAYIIFPFTHFSLLYMGFFNFMLGVMLSFLCIKLYLVLYRSPGLKNGLLLLLSIIALYFAHVFVFILVHMFFFLHFCSYLFVNYKTKTLVHGFKKFTLILVPALLPCLVLCLIYLIRRDNHYNFTYLDFDTTTWFYTNSAVLQAYGKEENLYCKIVTVILLLLGLTLFIQKIKTYLRSKQVTDLVKRYDLFLLMSVLMVVLSYTMPNEDGYGGYITIRIVLFAFLFYVLWLGGGLEIKKVAAPLMAALLICHFIQLTKKNKVILTLNSAVTDIEKASILIKPNSSVITFVGDENLWQAKHFGNYLAADKPVMIFDNYEADAGYFPVVWKYGTGTVRIDNLEPGVVCWKSGSDTTKQLLPDYIFTFDIRTSTCYGKNYPLIIKNYKVLQASSLVSLYIKK